MRPAPISLPLLLLVVPAVEFDLKLLATNGVLAFSSLNWTHFSPLFLIEDEMVSPYSLLLTPIFPPFAGELNLSLETLGLATGRANELNVFGPGD